MPRAPQKPKSVVDKSTAAEPKGWGRNNRIKRTPDLEIAIGGSIRAARVAARMSQTALGEAIGVTYQQMQKYETGKDRVAASTLQGIAAALGVHPGSFFDQDAPSPAPSSRSKSPARLADLRNAQRLGAHIERLENPALIRRLIALVDVMVEARGGAGDDGGRKPDGEVP